MVGYIISLKTDITSYQQEINELQIQVNTLQSQVTDKNLQYNELFTDYQGLNDTYHHLLASQYSISYLLNLDYFPQALSMINNANESIDIVMYNMAYYLDYPTDYSNILLEALVSAKNKGINVRVLVDDDIMGESTDYQQSITYLKNNDVSIRLDQNDNVTTHAKFMIIDGTILFVGSHNWTYSGLQKNNECSIMILGDIFNVSQYFQDLWNNGRSI